MNVCEEFLRKRDFFKGKGLKFMDRKEFMDKQRVLFDEFLEVVETMDHGSGQKDFIDIFFNCFFNSVYDQGAHKEKGRNLKIMSEIKEGLLEKTKN